MNWAHIHLILNHVPVLGTVFGLALLAWGRARCNQSLERAALVTFIVVALAALPTYFTGEPAEEVVEHLTGTAASAIEAHEEAALVALIFVELLGAIAMAAIAFQMAQGSRVLPRVALLISIVTVGLMVRTANLGGRIRHAELRGATTESHETISNHWGGFTR